MAQELVGIEALHSLLNGMWNNGYARFVKEKFLTRSESYMPDIVAEMADHAAGSVNTNDPVLVSDLITDYLNDRIDVKEKSVDAIIELQRSNGPRDFIAKTVLRIINDQAHQIFEKRFEESKEEWRKEAKNNHGTPGM